MRAFTDDARARRVRTKTTVTSIYRTVVERTRTPVPTMVVLIFFLFSFTHFFFCVFRVSVGHSSHGRALKLDNEILVVKLMNAVSWVAIQSVLKLIICSLALNP